MRNVSISSDNILATKRQNNTNKIFENQKNDDYETENQREYLLEDDVNEDDEEEKVVIEEIKPRFRRGKWTKSRKHYILCCKCLKGRELPYNLSKLTWIFTFEFYYIMQVIPHYFVFEQMNRLYFNAYVKDNYASNKQHIKTINQNYVMVLWPLVAMQLYTIHQSIMCVVRGFPRAMIINTSNLSQTYWGSYWLLSVLIVSIQLVVMNKSWDITF